MFEIGREIIKKPWINIFTIGWGFCTYEIQQKFALEWRK